MSKCTREDECDACHYGFGYQAHEFGTKCWMGPIARELRVSAQRSPFVRWLRMSEDSFDVASGAAAQLGLMREFLHTMDVDDDVLSEAIEAAEALGL